MLAQRSILVLAFSFTLGWGSADSASAAITSVFGRTTAQIGRSPILIDGKDVFNETGASVVAGADDWFALTSSNFSDAGMIVEFEQSRSGLKFASSNSFVKVSFTTSTNLFYWIRGEFENSSGLMVLRAVLVDETNGETLFDNYQTRDSSIPFVLSIGGLNGNTDESENFLLGRQVGSLFEGHRYFFGVDAYTYARERSDDGATAFGFGEIVFGNEPFPPIDPPPPVTAVPEPVSTAIWTILSVVSVAMTPVATCRRSRRDQ